MRGTHALGTKPTESNSGMSANGDGCVEGYNAVVRPSGYYTCVEDYTQTSWWQEQYQNWLNSR